MNIFRHIVIRAVQADERNISFVEKRFDPGLASLNANQESAALCLHEIPDHAEQMLGRVGHFNEWISQQDICGNRYTCDQKITGKPIFDEIRTS